jgi:hypothetical protein
MFTNYLDDRRERFFTWCDNVVQACIDRHNVEFKSWWPRKKSNSSYELVLELAASNKEPFKHSVSIPDEFHELLEREYFIDHPSDKDEH